MYDHMQTLVVVCAVLGGVDVDRAIDAALVEGLAATTTSLESIHS